MPKHAGPGRVRKRRLRWIPPGSRAGLLATFNGCFKLNAAQGGFYLNGHTSGTLAPGAASVVHYKNGTITIGAWDQTARMTSSVAGVRQNLKLIVDGGHVPASSRDFTAAYAR